MTDLNQSRLVRITGIQYGLSFLIDFSVTVLVARLLTPVEIGTFSVAMASLVLMQIIRSVGVNAYIVQAREMGPQQIAAALGFAISASIVLGLIALLVSGPIATFYGEPQMSDVIRVSAVGFIFVPVHSVASGLLMRELRVATVAVAALLGSLIGGAVTLMLAWRGLGAVSLAYGALTNVMVTCVIAAFATRKALMVRPRLSGWGNVWTISSWLVGGASINQVGVRLNELVVGRSLGLGHAAMLDRAEMLPRMVWSYIAPALLAILTPLIARELRTGGDARSLLIERMRYFSLIFIPVMLGMATQGDNLILTIFGPQWVNAIPSVVWLCLNGAIAGQAIVIASVLVAMGRTRETFVMSLCEQSMRVLVLIALAHSNITTISQGMVLVGCTYAFVAVMMARRCEILNFADLVPAVLPSLIAGAAIYAIGMTWRVVEARWLEMTPAASLISAIVILGASWLVLTWLIEPKLVKFGVRVATGR